MYACYKSTHFTDLLEKGMMAYNDAKSTEAASLANYRQAKDYFIQYRQIAPPTDDFYPSATLYLAISHLALKESAQAIPLLETLTQQNFPQQLAAQWYLALSYIQAEQTETAISILKTLERTEYGEQAKVILDAF